MLYVRNTNRFRQPNSWSYPAWIRELWDIELNIPGFPYFGA